MKQEVDIYNQIIKDSNKRMLSLQIISNFFNNKDLISVVIKTQIIHNLFHINRSLDCNKLELFHLQFTDSVIDLFQKLKKSKEQHYLLLTDEIIINNEIIDKLNSEIEADNYHENCKIHAQIMSKKIEQLYQSLASNNSVLFSWNEINNFSENSKLNHFREISLEQYDKLTLNDKQTYQNEFAMFEKKLLGRLNIFHFKIKFICGLVCNNNVVEVFEFRDSNDKFIFINNNKSFYFLEKENQMGVDLTKNTSSKNDVLHDLHQKNNVLKTSLETIKTSLPENVKEVLKNYVEKIASVNFIDDLKNVDEQTNILKTMLNIKIN